MLGLRARVCTLLSFSHYLPMFAEVLLTTLPEWLSRLSPPRTQPWTGPHIITTGCWSSAPGRPAVPCNIGAERC